jgi:hypothetical protein
VAKKNEILFTVLDVFPHRIREVENLVVFRKAENVVIVDIECGGLAKRPVGKLLRRAMQPVHPKDRPLTAASLTTSRTKM